jgi:hypothetical protein
LETTCRILLCLLGIRPYPYTTSEFGGFKFIPPKDYFKKQYPILCALQLTYSYLNVLRQQNISYESIEGRLDLEFAFNKYQIDADREFTINEFVSELFAEINDYGFECFKKIIGIKVNGNFLTSQYILDNVTGAGFNALYMLENEMDKMANLSKHLKNDDPQYVMLEAIQAIINNPLTQYSTIELSREILCGCLLAEQIYKEEKHIESDTSAPLPDSDGGFSIQDFIGDYVDISYHAFLNT